MELGRFKRKQILEEEQDLEKWVANAPNNTEKLEGQVKVVSPLLFLPFCKA